MSNIKKQWFAAAVILSLTIHKSEAQIIPNGSVAGTSAELLYPPAAYNGNAKINFVRTWEPWMPISDAAQVPLQTVTNVKQTTAYVDGLGRPIQTVTKQISPLQKDMAAAKLFDEYGKEVLQYLPYVSPQTDGSFKVNPFQEQQNYYSNPALNNGQYGGEVFYYGKTVFETSPLMRPELTMAPGNSWAGSNRGVGLQYMHNTTADAVRIWKINDAAGSTPTTVATYDEATLIKTITSDEHSKQVIEYKDKEGRMILKKVQLAASPGSDHSGWLCTYYIYDDYGQLRTVIQPRAVELLEGSWVLSSSLLAEQCFIYEYDSRNRMIIKKVPGAGEVWMVYDARDRLVMTQDALLRTQNKWLVTQYDAADRPTVTGFLTSSNDRAWHQNIAWSSTAYPFSISEELTRTFYDYYNYSGVKAFDNGDLSKLPDNGNPWPDNIVKSDLTYGQVTGAKIKTLGTTQYLISTTYYDEKGRAIQVLADNIKNGVDVTTSRYDFTGKPLSNYIKHNNPACTAAPTVRILTKMLYDHAGRLKYVWKQLNDSGNDKLIVQNAYDELGQLKDKTLSPTGGPGGAPLETLNYEYNIRGWLKSINKEYALNPAWTGNWFGQTLSYDYGFSSQQYNGNISGIQWRSKGDDWQRAYGYTYDAVNRLKSADFTQYNFSSWNTNWGLDFTVSNLNYDANGNILNMRQKGWKLGGSVLIDNLTYTYQPSSNKLAKVTDAITADNKLGDFKDGTNAGSDDYGYDANGNLTTDFNKNIIANQGNNGIVYNHLNLPVMINVGGKGTIEYVYDAAGNKLKKQTYDIATGQTTVTTYIAGFVYRNDTLEYASHEEGRIRRKTNGTYQYDYFIKDHLGNVRMVLTEEQQTDMYPLASMETAQAATEELYYANLPATRSDKPSGYPYDPYTNPNDKVAKVSAANGNQQIGPAIVLKVMSGDKFNLQVSSWWNGVAVPDAPVNPLNDLINAMAGGIGNLGGNNHVTAAELINSGALTQGITDFLSKIDGLAYSNRPRAFVNWLMLDEQFKYVEASGFEQVGAGLGADVDGPPGPFSTHVRANLPVTKNGYLYIYVSNATPNIDVFFDNLQVTHIRGPLLETNEFYPFGLTVSALSSKSLAFGEPGNKRKYNGIEKENDLEIEIYDAQLRELDGQIGRWWEIDPKIENMEMWSPYASNYDNPITYMDPLGDEPEDGDGCCKEFLKKAGNFLAGTTIGVAVGITDNITGSNFRGEMSKEFEGTGAAGHGWNAGLDIADVGGMLLGAAETATGTVGAIGASVVTVTTAGVATPVTVPIAVGSVALAVHGVYTFSNSYNNLVNQNGRVNASSKQTGSYTTTHKSGKTYSGKGPETRAKESANRIEKEKKDPVKKIDWKPSKNTRGAFKDEDKRIQKNGGAGNTKRNYNRINSPGRKYNEQDKH